MSRRGLKALGKVVEGGVRGGGRRVTDIACPTVYGVER